MFTMRVGNILPGERVTVALTLVGPLSYEDGEATFRFPLVVAPRYIPGAPLAGRSVGDGLRPGHRRGAGRLADHPAGAAARLPQPAAACRSRSTSTRPGCRSATVRSSLHTVIDRGRARCASGPGERADRDFVLRSPTASRRAGRGAVTVTPDAEGDEGTFLLTVLPPARRRPATAARRGAAARPLRQHGRLEDGRRPAGRRPHRRHARPPTTGSRCSPSTTRSRRPPSLGDGLVAATDRNRFRAVEHLSRVEARGGTELLAPLRRGLRPARPTRAARDRVLVLVTDGQVGNEDQILPRGGR